MITFRSEGNFKDLAENMPEDPVGCNEHSTRVWNCIPGVFGKTTISKQINNNFCCQPQDFKFVICFMVKKLQLEKIQEGIGKKKGFSS